MHWHYAFSCNVQLETIELIIICLVYIPEPKIDLSAFGFKVLTHSFNLCLQEAICYLEAEITYVFLSF